MAALALEAVRCFLELRLELGEQTIILGANATGKSTVLEAIYVLFLGQSFRRASTHDLINRNQSQAVIGLLADHRYTIQLNRTGPRPIKRDGKPERWAARIGSLPLSLFAPEEFLFYILPEYRRHALNRLLIQTNPAYRSALHDYHRLLRQRNHSLKRLGEAPDREVIRSIDTLLLPLAAAIQTTRAEAITALSELFPRPLLSARYLPSVRTETTLEAELRAQQTLRGPHRDDWRLDVRGQDAITFASRGEQREGLLYLALAEAMWLESRARRRPLLLLDDIVAEFDSGHRLALAQLLKHREFILTSAEMAFVPPGLRRTSSMITLGRHDVAKNQRHITAEFTSSGKPDEA